MLIVLMGRPFRWLEIGRSYNVYCKCSCMLVCDEQSHCLQIPLYGTKTGISRALLKIDQQIYTFLESPHQDGSSGTTYIVIGRLWRHLYPKELRKKSENIFFTSMNSRAYISVNMKDTRKNPPTFLK